MTDDNFDPGFIQTIARAVEQTADDLDATETHGIKGELGAYSLRALAARLRAIAADQNGGGNDG